MGVETWESLSAADWWGEGRGGNGLNFEICFVDKSRGIRRLDIGLLWVQTKFQHDYESLWCTAVLSSVYHLWQRPPGLIHIGDEIIAVVDSENSHQVLFNDLLYATRDRLIRFREWYPAEHFVHKVQWLKTSKGIWSIIDYLEGTWYSRSSTSWVSRTLCPCIMSSDGTKWGSLGANGMIFADIMSELLRFNSSLCFQSPFQVLM